ncbi:MAG: hypothetical protein Kow00104_11020 [Rhodothalassiaceae bacterium]
MPSLDFRIIEDDADFRAALLYYLQLANSYIASIFWDCFPDGTRRKKLYDLVRAFAANRKIDDKLYKSLAPDGEGGLRRHLDVYKEHFVAFLREGLPVERQNAIRDKLRLKHAIPLGFEQFSDAIDLLRRKRHYLKDFESRKHNQARVADNEMLRLLGLFLLPAHHQHLLHEIERATRRAGAAARSAIPAADLRAILSAARRERREETERIFGQGRSRQVLAKHARDDLHEAREALNRRYQHYYPAGAWPRYNLHKFLIRYHFIGDGMIRLIEKALAGDTPQSAAVPHFEREIEAVHALGTRINRHIWKTVASLEAADKTLTRGERKTSGAMTDRLYLIRNCVAHNQPFFAVHDGNGHVPVEDVFGAVLAGLVRPHVGPDEKGRKAAVAAFAGGIEHLLARENFSLVAPCDADGRLSGPPRKIRRWTVGNRKTYIGRSGWKIDKRKRVRRLAADWRNALRRALESLAEKGAPGEEN